MMLGGFHENALLLKLFGGQFLFAPICSGASNPLFPSQLTLWREHSPEGPCLGLALLRPLESSMG